MKPPNYKRKITPTGTLFCLIWVGIISAALIYGFQLRQTFTHITEDPSSLDTLYAFAYPGIKKQLASEGVEHSVDSIASLKDDADLIAVVTFSGKRIYGFKSFASQISVEKVIEDRTGQHISAQSNIYVYEPYSMTYRYIKDENKRKILEQAEQEQQRKIPYFEPNMSPNRFGKCIMLPDTPYLVFLKLKQRPKQVDEITPFLEFNFFSIPYSRLPLSDLEQSVQVVDGLQLMSFAELSQVDQRVNSVESRTLYLTQAEQLLHTYL